ncbi:glycerate dehydrogenase [Westerdykella ornata]|uniref:Glycerate dehydrogenase n=1 Tax=Westerdykella ornata TaxID=318751 RepID=A0A6A6J895_WESOR|nr:glycerate dehydrogenase [Westerdykella ornata]KAF2271429.1 glycerate dehydrogenase [Westerdykella ornata]
MAVPEGTLNLAILDDYHNLFLPILNSLPQPFLSRLSITAIPDTLPAYNHPSTTAAEKEALISRLRPFHILITMRERTPFPAEVISQLPNLKILFATGAKFDGWGLEEAFNRGIPICAAPGKGRTDGKGTPLTQQKKKGVGAKAHPTTQHVWALILALTRNVAEDDANVKAGGWQTGLATGLQGRTLGIVGLGKIGVAVARVGVLAWGMRVVCWSASLTQEAADRRAEEMGLPVEDEDGEKVFKVVGMEELFRTADVVSVHYTLSERSRRLVGKEQLGWMKKEALFVNTARGPLVDEDALLEVLRKKRIRGAALDVFDVEPLPKSSPWRTEKWDEVGKDGKRMRSRVLLTPHMGFVEEERLKLWYEETVENLERWLNGEEVLHVINSKHSE